MKDDERKRTDRRTSEERLVQVLGTKNIGSAWPIFDYLIKRKGVKLIQADLKVNHLGRILVKNTVSNAIKKLVAAGLVAKTGEHTSTTGEYLVVTERGFKAYDYVEYEDANFP